MHVHLPLATEIEWLKLVQVVKQLKTIFPNLLLLMYLRGHSDEIRSTHTDSFK